MSSALSSQVLFSGNASLDQAGIQAYSFDEVTGKLKLIAAFSGFEKPSYILPHPNAKWLYAVSETAQQSDGVPGSVLAIAIEKDPMRLKVINRHLSGGDWPCHLRLDRSAKWLFVSNYQSGSAAVFPILEDGSLGERSDHLQWQGGGPNRSRQAGAHAHSSILSPDNRFLIVADLGSDLLLIHEFDPTNGKLKFHQRIAARPGAGPRHMLFHPNGQKFYVTNELDNSVTVYAYDSLNGNLSPMDTLQTLPPDMPENIVADLHLSSDAHWLYVSNRGHNSLALFRVDEDGGLSRKAIYKCGGNWPRNFSISPGGRFILVANQNSGDICSLPLAPDSGEIGEPVDSINIPHPTCVQFLLPPV